MITGILVALVAGWGAGVVTGIIGASAATVVVPMLITILHFEAYQAIGVSLATDVICSAVAAYTYARHGHVKFRASLPMASCAVTGVLLGSLASRYIPSASLGGATGILILLMGISFMRKPINLRAQAFKERVDLSLFKRHSAAWSALCGLGIGLMCGTVGAGGGEAMSLILLFVLDYPIHSAVGTSVLIMVFTAFTGAVGHGLYAPFPASTALIAACGGAIGAWMAARFASLASEEKLGKVIGAAFLVLGIITTVGELVLPHA
ncbi:MAG TPA: sulfite exporter TauE/SafE family protein [Candidatus Bipolaricaulis sp.]|nr:sulfite exporter TauE/SafE family protein [Candidatus Bipolaricaulis sp.]HRS13688.1 sulfite exporter TauE/SafE family protein [Candidatus Bipolaricaulis sp.]HRU21604.1 sulfite exporter TauE/SafE family protein [Candidatus Bipolaricaulis sp.]